MWRGENPVEDFDRLMSVIVLDLLNKRVDCILMDMKESRVAAATKLSALKAKKGRPRILGSTPLTVDYFHVLSPSGW